MQWPILFPTITKLRSVTAVIVTREIRWRWPININNWHGIAVKSVRVAQLYNALFEFLYALKVLLCRLALQTMNLHHQQLDLSHALHQVWWCRWVWGIGRIWNDGSCWDGLWDWYRVYRVWIGVWKWLRDGHGHGHGDWVLWSWVLHRYHKALRDESSVRIHYRRRLFWEGKKYQRHVCFINKIGLSLRFLRLCLIQSRIMVRTITAPILTTGMKRIAIVWGEEASWWNLWASFPRNWWEEPCMQCSAETALPRGQCKLVPDLKETLCNNCCDVKEAQVQWKWKSLELSGNSKAETSWFPLHQAFRKCNTRIKFSPA